MRNSFVGQIKIYLIKQRPTAYFTLIELIFEIRCLYIN
jgi:hypothetical protein